MKKIITLMLITVLSINIYAQEDFEKKPKLYLKSGVSVYSNGSIVSFSSKSIPFNDKINRSFVFTLHYEQYYGEKISVGWSLSGQRFHHKQSNWIYTNNLNNIDTSDVVFNLNRLNISTATLFDWFNNGSIRIYSGVRIGVTVWKSSTNIDNRKEPLFEDGYVVSPQLIVYGSDFAFSEKIGGNMEIAIGAPYYFAFGLFYNF